MEITIPQDVQRIINTLHDNEFEAYIVGGCVRDTILGITPKDWDIATDALPSEIKGIFGAFPVIDTGIEHGTVTIIINRVPYETTTYRVDGLYTDGRHPDSVHFTRCLREDLSRRDFTINAMAYNDKEGLIDFFGGRTDLKRKMLVCVGNAEERLSEDYLRILRAFRFAEKYQLDIHPDIYFAIQNNINGLLRISAERIQAELNGILLNVRLDGETSQMKPCMRVLSESVIPELKECMDFDQNTPYHHLHLDAHIIASVAHIDSDIILRLTMFLHDIGKPSCRVAGDDGIDHYYGHARTSADIASTIMKRLKYSNEIHDNVVELISRHDSDIRPERPLIKRMLNKIGYEQSVRLVKVRIADVKSHSDISIHRFLSDLQMAEKLIHQIYNEEEPFSLKHLAINGTDIMGIGVPQGRLIGDLLNKCLIAVLDNPKLNSREHLFDIVKENLRLEDTSHE